MHKAALLILISFVSGSIQAQDYFSNPENRHPDHLILVHPTRNNLQHYRYLKERSIFNAGELKVVGLYFKGEEYDYSGLLEEFPEIGFQETGHAIGYGDIFRENECTPSFRMYFECSRGIIFNGGPDIPPAIYGEETSTLTDITDPYRHTAEVSFLFHLLGSTKNRTHTPWLEEKPNYLILGICLGMQTMVVATGGSLVQDIPSEVYRRNTIEKILRMPSQSQHRNYGNDLKPDPPLPGGHLHPIKIYNEGWISLLSLFEPYVLTSHHQAVENLGKEWIIAASSTDRKIVEVIIHRKYPNVTGIQFHPEVRMLYMPENSGEYPFQKPGAVDLDFHLQFWRYIRNSLIKP